MGDGVIAAIVTGGFALLGTIITAVVAQIRGSRTRLGVGLWVSTKTTFGQSEYYYFEYAFFN